MTTATATQTAPAEAGTTDVPVTVDFWFDPACPWAWLTSRWVHEVTTVRPVDVRWHVMSLAILNEGKQDTDEHRQAMERLRRPLRVIVAAQARHGDEIAGPLYTALGTHIHYAREGNNAESLAAALADVGLEPDLADAADDPSWDDAVRASHDAGMAPVGNDVGTPVLHIEGTAFFGPVVSPLPRGEQAGRLWDGYRLVTSTPGFYEIKRSRDGRPSFD
jgi:2-hydroxychromene-2-carboxylate isomerase